MKPLELPDLPTGERPAPKMETPVGRSVVSVEPAPTSACTSGPCSTGPAAPAAALRGPDLPSLPEIFTAALSRDEVLRLLRDVRRQTEVLGLTLKGGAMLYAAEDTSDTPAALDARLGALVDALEAPEALAAPLPGPDAPRQAIPHGAQLRYNFGGVVFYDTLIRRGDHWRLTRIAPPHAQPQTPA